ncbi:N5-glutamine methyltransferase family protein [Niabella hibiscisoli]|uniref:N5-glutamine methyltransferase family protein n=1 Tax=Niabella hibiscisoli TaxID=1825928 RepID=UPI001F0D65F2|nr:methyltransferase [Niabella hibiscisoli]MCH5720417.1 methyltransferase [Niabella hibiscisoli]
MSLQKLKAGFVENLKSVYPSDEASNLFNLAIEHLTGINLRNNSAATFTPDGCFMKMWSEMEQRLRKAEPIQYILNEAWFYDIPFYVNQSVLIPRPETEELVEWIIKDHQGKRDLSILDIGTGSGCIPVILKRKIPQAEVISCDISAAALEVAKKMLVSIKLK